MSEWFQIAVIVFIVLTIGWHTMAAARANPKDTGELDDDLTVLAARVEGLMNFKDRFGELELDVGRLKKNTASKADIDRLEKAIDAVQTEVVEIGKSAASREATLDHVKQQVDRMLDIIVKRGM